MTALFKHRHSVYYLCFHTKLTQKVQELFSLFHRKECLSIAIMMMLLTNYSASSKKSEKAGISLLHKNNSFHCSVITFIFFKKSLLTSLTHGRSMSNWENQPFHTKITDGKSIFIRQNYLPTHYIGISTSKDVKEQIEVAVSKGHIPRYHHCI